MSVTSIKKQKNYKIIKMNKKNYKIQQQKKKITKRGKKEKKKENLTGISLTSSSEIVK